MTDLLTKVKWALRAHKENFALDEDLEHLSLDMAHALIAARELADRVNEWSNENLTDETARDWFGHVEPALETFRAAMEY
jgi:hypothetical protein